MTARVFSAGVRGLGAISALGLFVAAARAQDKPAVPPAQPGPAEMAAMMEKMKAAATPGPHHKALEPFVGKWNLVLRMYMGGPGTPPAETKGTSEVRWILDGRFLMEEFKSEMLMPDATGAIKPVPYQGLGLTGYDNTRNMYVGSWSDTLSTHLLIQRGQRDPSGKVFTFYGEMDEPMLNVVGRMVKYVSRIESADKHVFEIFDLHAGDNYKVLEIVYTRK